MQFLAERLKRARKGKGLTQQKLAELAEVSQRSIASWESGDNEPQGENLRKLCKVLQVPIEHLFGDIAGPGGPNSYLRDTTEYGTPQRIQEYLQKVIDACKGDTDRLSWLYIELMKRFPLSDSKVRAAAQYLLGATAEKIDRDSNEED